MLDGSPRSGFFRLEALVEKKGLVPLLLTLFLSPSPPLTSLWVPPAQVQGGGDRAFPPWLVALPFWVPQQCVKVFWGGSLRLPLPGDPFAGMEASLIWVVALPSALGVWSYPLISLLVGLHADRQEADTLTPP